MRLLLIAAQLVAALTLSATAAVASTTTTVGPWKPGTPTYATEDDVNNLLERVVDHAYCQGIPRFGHRGTFPDDEYVVFDCDWSHNGTFCSGMRYKAVKASPRGYFRVKQIRRGNCY